MSADPYERTDLAVPAPHPRGPLPRTEAPIVPKSTIAGRALIAVVAIMTFLASLTTGAVMLVRASAAEWQSDISREVTIQVRPVSGRDIEADVKKAAAIAGAAAGIASVRPYSRDESLKLLEPWLGTGLSLDDLPVPRLIVVKVQAGISTDFGPLQRTLADQVPGATLDDHRGWVERMRAMTGTAVAGGIVILALVAAATILSVTFATRGAMAANRPIIEVLHFVGAKQGYIASHFQRHFLMLGLQGGLIGGGAALVVFLAADVFTRGALSHESADEIAALFGTFSIGFWGYILVAAQIVVIAMVTAATSRHTVNRTLSSID